MENGQSYKLTLEEKHLYMFARVTGHVNSGQDSLAYLQKIAEHCSRYGCSSILIEKDTPEPFAIWDTFSVAPQLATATCPGIKIAIVARADEPHAKRQLSVMVGTKCGMDVHAFTTTAEAKHWLLTPQPPSVTH